MRRQAKLLSNFLGAAKELTGEYVDLAEITEDEQNQIRASIVSRPDLKEMVKRQIANNVPLKEIADNSGWSLATIKRTAAKIGLTKHRSKVSNDTLKASNDTSTGGAATKQRRADIAANAAADGTTEEPDQKYRIIYADPPWSYGNTQPDYQTEQRDHYPVMELEAICGLPVEQWAADNAVLFLWATSPILEEAFDVIRHWGFEYKASFVWDKIKHNMGHYNSVRHELLLICVRGSCQPDSQQLFDSVQSIERGKHSEKPVEFYDIIETLYTHGKKLEIFARNRREGWDVYGHQAEILEAAE